MRIEPLSPDHLRKIQLHDSQQYLAGSLNGSAPEKVVMIGDGYSAIDDHGEVIYCAGVLPVWPGRGIAWAYISMHACRHMLKVTRSVRRYLEITPHRRIEAAVDVGFEEGHRWMRLLDFNHEGRLEAYAPDGHDVDLYARIKR